MFNFETNLPFCSHFFHHQALRHQVIVRNWLLACFSSSGNYIQILGHKILRFKQVEQPTQSEKNFGGSLTIEQYIWQHNYHHHCCNNITISHRPAQQQKSSLDKYILFTKKPVTTKSPGICLILLVFTSLWSNYFINLQSHEHQNIIIDYNFYFNS